MEIALRTQYALRALVCLTVKRGEQIVSGGEIAAFGGIPRKYVEQVMHDLRQAGLVRSQRGKLGGYVLARDPATISVLDVVEAVEGPLADLGRMRGGDPVGPLLEPVWDDLRVALRESLGATSVASIADRVAVYMYHI